MGCPSCPPTPLSASPRHPKGLLQAMDLPRVTAKELHLKLHTRQKSGPKTDRYTYIDTQTHTDTQRHNETETDTKKHRDRDSETHTQRHTHIKTQTHRYRDIQTHIDINRESEG